MRCWLEPSPFAAEKNKRCSFRWDRCYAALHCAVRQCEYANARCNTSFIRVGCVCLIAPFFLSIFLLLFSFLSGLFFRLSRMRLGSLDTYDQKQKKREREREGGRDRSVSVYHWEPYECKQRASFWHHFDPTRTLTPTLFLNLTLTLTF